MIGQSWTSTSPPSSVTDLRDTLRTEATAAGATFIDPLAERWFVTDTTQLVSRDGVTLTDQGHRYLAEQLQPASPLPSADVGGVEPGEPGVEQVDQPLPEGGHGIGGGVTGGSDTTGDVPAPMQPACAPT